MNTIVIIGGGIGGLTLAIALRQRDIIAEVYEATPELRPAGAGILMPPNAMQVFGQISLAADIARAGMPLRSGDILDVQAGLLQHADLDAVAERFGFPTIAIHRGRLHQALVAALDPGQLHLGKAFVALTKEADGVRVRFTDGDEVRARAVVGADGLRSAVRQQLFPESRLRYSGQSSYRAVAPLTLPPSFDGVSWEVWGPGCRFGFAAIAPDEVYWFVTLAAAAGALRGQTPFKPRLAALFAAFPPPIGELIDATPEAAIINTDIHDLRQLPHWRMGRVGLLGDAAHATTPNLGQGGAQAVEDAAVLARCLVANNNPEVAFGAYERRRRAKAAMVVKRSWQFGKLPHMRNPILRAARNLLVRGTPASVTRRQLEQLYRIDEGPIGLLH